jgi:hypothetical protein
MLGYWNDEGATRAAIDAGRWMHTGDLGTMDDEGYVNIVGRIKDMIARGGEKIFPREVEEFLHTHPAIAEAQVVGVPSAKYGEEVMAWVRPKSGATVTPEELTAFCTGKIATFKIPRYWKITSEFPMTVTGKIQKFRMREIATAELGLGDAAAVRTHSGCRAIRAQGLCRALRAFSRPAESGPVDREGDGELAGQGAEHGALGADAVDGGGLLAGAVRGIGQRSGHGAVHGEHRIDLGPAVLCERHAVGAGELRTVRRAGERRGAVTRHDAKARGHDLVDEEPAALEVSDVGAAVARHPHGLAVRPLPGDRRDRCSGGAAARARAASAARAGATAGAGAHTVAAVSVIVVAGVVVHRAGDRDCECQANGCDASHESS